MHKGTKHSARASRATIAAPDTNSSHLGKPLAHGSRFQTRKTNKTATPRHGVAPLAMLATAVAGALCGLAAVFYTYPGFATTTPASGQSSVVSADLGASLPLSFGPAQSSPLQAQNVNTGAKTDMAAPLLTRFASLSSSAMMSDTPMVLQASLNIEEPVSGTAEIMKSPPPEPVDRTFALEPGQTLAGKLVELGVKPSLAVALATRLDRVWPLKKIRPGQKFVVTLEQQPDFSGLDVTYPVYLSFSPQPGTQVVVEAGDEGQFIASVKRNARAIASKPATPAAKGDLFRVKGRISSSLYAAAKDKGVPGYIISQMLRALGHQVDLQRQVKKGSTFEVLYGKPFSGTSSRRYVLHYVALDLGKRKLSFYRYTTPDGKTAYFDSKGRSARRGLMRTPISGARISSGFGMRRHPVLGYTKMHTGVDFAAPTGTPIHAAGPGKVIHAGWRGGYGRTVMIKHPSGHVTLYAHQSRIARGIRKGVKVRQGQVIGYVGATGRVTGPHLHFEVHIKGRKVNPLRVRTANRQQLSGKALKQFRKRMARIRELLDKIPTTTQIARR